MLSSDQHPERRLAQYTALRGCLPEERLGFGNNGVVWSTDRRSAIKLHHDPTAFGREKYAYQVFQGTVCIASHSVPILLDFDDKLLALEMTIVQAPFVLDFASAYPLANAPEFPPDRMDEWLLEKQEQFGEDWPAAAAVVRAVERDYGLRLIDVHPGNICSRA